MNNGMDAPTQYGGTVSQSSPGLIARIAAWKASLLRRVVMQDQAPMPFLFAILVLVILEIYRPCFS